MAKEANRVRRKERKNIVSGVAHVNSTFNNTMITITDAQGNTISWSSAGTMALRVRANPHRSPPRSPPKTRSRSSEHGMRTLEVEVSGPGSGRNRRCAPSRRRVQRDLHQRRDAHSAQRLPSAQAP